MAFLSIHHLPGDPDDLLRRKQMHMDPVVNRLAGEFGAIMSVTVTESDGLVTVNLWHDARGAREFTTHPEVVAAQRNSGLPAPDRFERYEDAVVTHY